MTWHWRTFVGSQILAFLVILQPVWGQSTSIPEAPSHRFIDRQNVTAFAVLGSLITIDAVHTQFALQTHDFVEGDPLARPFVTKGWTGQLAGSALGYGTALSFSYLLHRSNHHKLERWTTWLLVGAEATNDVRNFLLKPGLPHNATP
jgi:hypothetical protein